MKPPAYTDTMLCLATDALAAAYDGSGIPHDQHVPRAWWELTTALPCPECGSRRYRIISMMVHLSTAHRWSREAIAQWIDDAQSASAIQIVAASIVGAVRWIRSQS